MNAVFVDTTGWFSLLNRRDAWHEKACSAMQDLSRSGTPLITTDYIVDETATLLKMRGAIRSLATFFDRIGTSRALTLTGVTPERFAESRDFFLQHLDHGYSFTDVTSFVVMRELELQKAFTHDGHFEEAGFVRLLT